MQRAKVFVKSSVFLGPLLKHLILSIGFLHKKTVLICQFRLAGLTELSVEFGSLLLPTTPTYELRSSFQAQRAS